MLEVQFNMNIKQTKEIWKELKDYLLAVHKEYEDRNGLPYCKNCGVDSKALVEKIQTLLDKEKNRYYLGLLDGKKSERTRIIISEYKTYKHRVIS